MSADPALDPDNPFPLGESPYHVKGGIYLGTRLYFEREVPGGFEALLAALPEPLRGFISQPFMPVGWYDALGIPPLVRAEAAVAGKSVRNYLRERAAFQARQDISGVYRLLLKLTSPDAVAVRLPRLTTQILDFGTLEVRQPGPGVVTALFAGHPAMLWEWYSNAFKVYCESALTQAGARELQLAMPAPTPEPAREGLPMISFAITAFWSR